jgi:hypothetical protein
MVNRRIWDGGLERVDQHLDHTACLTVPDSTVALNANGLDMGGLQFKKGRSELIAI